MFDQYGATDEAASQHTGGGFGSGPAGFDPSEIFKNIFTGGFGNGGFDIFGNSTTGFTHANLDVTVCCHVMSCISYDPCHTLVGFDQSVLPGCRQGSHHDGNVSTPRDVCIL